MKKKFTIHLVVSLFWIMLLVLYLIQPGGWQKSKIFGAAFSSVLAAVFIFKSIKDLKDNTDQN